MERIYVRNANSMWAFDVSATPQELEDLMCSHDMDRFREHLENTYNTTMDCEGGSRYDGLGDEGGFDLPDLPGKRRAQKILADIRNEVQKLRPTWTLGQIALVP